MTDLVIACLSQKGGVGKSTLARQDLSARISYQRAQNFGRALSEVGASVGALEAKADTLAAEIVDYLTQLQETVS